MKIPTYDNFQAAPTVTPNVGVQEYGGPNGQQLAGGQMQEAGAAAQRAGDSAVRIALAMQEQINQVRVNDAVNKARQAAQDLAYNPASGYLNLKGDAALTRPGGQDLTTEYGGKLQQKLGEIAGTLGNDVQRRQFQMNAGDLQTQFHGQLETHMLGEFRSHALSVQDGTINLASDDAKRNWSNPDLIGPSLAAAKAAVVEKGRVSGWSAVQTDAALLTTTSKVHSDVIMAALENNNSNYAMAYMNARKGEMSAHDILRLQGQVNQSVWANQSLGAVQAATSKAMPAIAPTNFDRMVALTLGAESGGRRYGPDGKTLLTSPAGAKGEMQVLDSTNADPGFGVRPAANDSPDERARVGRDYLQALLQKYGDPAKAWAAYNAGPGKLDAALAEADKDAKTGAFRGPAPEDAWLAKLPKETQAYVAKNVQQLQGSGGQAPRPTELDFVNTALAQLPAGAPPQVVKMTREQAVGQFAIINKSLAEIGDDSERAAQQWLVRNGGNFAALPPSLRDAVTQHAPGRMDDLVRYARALDKGENVSDLGLYNRLAAHPEEMTAMSDVQFESLRAYLSQADFKHFSNERAGYLNGKVDESAGAINSKALNQSLTTRLEGLGVDTKPSARDLRSRERLGGIQQFVRDSIFDAQRQAGKKLTADEIERHVDALFAKSVEFRSTFLGFDTGTESQNLMSMRFDDLPAGAADGLRQALINSGNRNPTRNDILNLYRKMHARKLVPSQNVLPVGGYVRPETIGDRVGRTWEDPAGFVGRAFGFGRGGQGSDDEPNI